MSPVKVLLLRHGESVSNAHPTAASLPEAEGDRLSERGWEQARRAAGALGDRGVTRLVASPMRRTQETATPISEALGIPIETDDGIYELREREGYGELPPEEQKLQRWSARMVEQAEDPAYAPPGAESFEAIRERVRSFKRRLEAMDGTPLAVTHGIFLRFMLIDTLLGDDFGPGGAARLWQMRTVNCGLSVFEHGEPRHPADHDTDEWICAMWMEPLGS